MKKILSFLFITSIFVSCADIDTNLDEQGPEEYQPKELRLKSISLKWNGNIAMKTEDTEFYYDQNGLLSTIEYFQVLETAEERQTKNFYYTGLYIDSLIIDYHYLITSGPNTGKENKSFLAYTYTHDKNGFITDEKCYGHDRRIISHTKYFYKGEYLVRTSRYMTPSFPNEPYTVEGTLNYNSDGNVESAGDNRFIYDDMNTVIKNVYAPSLHRLLVNSKNNVLKFYYNTSGGFEEYKYTYNKDLYPETRKTYDGGKLIKNEVFTYY